MNQEFLERHGIAALFQPFTIKSVTLANRFIMPGMQRSWCKEGAPQPRMAAYYRRRIMGGVPLIISESCAVAHPTATAQSLACKMDRKTAPAWTECIGSVRDAGGHFLVQLWHEGALRSDTDGQTISPSGLAYPRFKRGRAATKEDLEGVIDAYVESSRLAKDAGANGVELHCAHGFFLDQFLWAATNLRKDEFGGETLAERATLHARILTAIRRECGDDFLLSVRFSQWKEKDYGARVATSPADLKGFTDLLRDAGADLFHASARRFWEPEWEGSERTIAGWTREVSGVPTIAVGSAGLDRDVMQSFETNGDAEGIMPETIERLGQQIASESFDFLAVGRSLIGDPDWVKKLKEGDIGSIRPFRKSDISDFEWDE